MFLSKIALLILCLFYTETTNGSETYCDGSGWEQFRDEKCYKLIQDWASRDQTKELCAQEWLPQSDASTPQLVSIKSVEEQNFLTDYVYNKSGVEINVWIGAKRSSKETDKFVWDDDSDLDFTNWAQDSPSDEIKKGCVIIQSQLMKNTNGKWKDVSCQSPNYVLCEKLQRWSFSKLQQCFLDTRKKLDNTENQLMSTQSELVSAQIRLNGAETRIENSRKNPVPIGFIYVQLSSQTDPRNLWTTVQWEDVTAKYGGLFFRAEGGASAPFDTIQSDNAPRVTLVHIEKYTVSDGAGKWVNTTLTPGRESSGLGVFSGSWDGVSGYTHRFYQSGGEVRPRNTAMRIWKRI